MAAKQRRASSAAPASVDRPGGYRRWPRSRWPLLAAGAVLAIGALVLLRVRQPAGDNPATAEAGVVHVHGLGVNPQDGALYAATHTGLFRIPQQGQAERVAGRWQDTMGLIIVGPNRFLASGHPDLRELRERQLPPLLGLIESTDAGVSWQSRSLSGVADLHALRTSQGWLYGYNSSADALMSSNDGASWETRAPLAISDFVVSPTEPDRILAVTESGLQRSVDGGRSWTPLTAPALALLAWETADKVWGLGPDGAVYQSGDSGATWRQRGTLPGQPEAFLAANRVLYAAVAGGGIYASDDEGGSWKMRYRDPV